MFSVSDLSVGSTQAILQSLLLPLESVCKGHGKKYTLAGTLSVFPGIKLSHVFFSPHFCFLKFFPVGAFEAFSLDRGEDSNRCYAKHPKIKTSFSIIRAALNNDIYIFSNYQEITKVHTKHCSMHAISLRPYAICSSIFVLKRRHFCTIIQVSNAIFHIKGSFCPAISYLYLATSTCFLLYIGQWSQTKERK